MMEREVWVEDCTESDLVLDELTARGSDAKHDMLS